MTTRPTISWTPERLEKLREARNLAIKQRVKTFSIEIDRVKADFDVGYAKYLIEYLDGQFRTPAPAARPQDTGEESTSASSIDGDVL